MKRKISIFVTSILMLLCLCLAFAACGKTPEGPSGGTETEEGGTTTPSGDPTEPDDKDKPHDHIYTAENVCEICGTKWQYSDGLIYKANDDGTYSVTGIGTASGEVVLPYGYEGKFVTAIANRAFRGSEGLTGITIPDSVTTIGYDAFSGTPIYENQENWDNDVLYLGGFLIKAKTTLADEYTVREGTKIVAAQGFNGCTSLTGITIPASVKAIDDTAFSGCTALSTIEVAEENQNYSSEDGVLYNKAKTKIAFVSKTHAGTLTIPESVEEIGSIAFSGCKAIEAYVVGEGSAAFSSQDGVLYNKGKTEIAYVPDALKGEITIPSTLVEIGDMAFQGRSGITSVKFEIGVTSIGTRAFSGCSGITGEIWIPGSVKSIGSNAFYGCNGISSMTIPFTGDGKGLSYTTRKFEFIFGGASYISTSLKSITIYSSKIEESAFWGVPMETMTLAEGVASVGKAAFAECKNLKTIFLPSTLKKFETMSAFQNCINLETINYAGKIEDWKGISGALIAVKNLKQVTIHCKDGDCDYLGNVIPQAGETN